MPRLKANMGKIQKGFGVLMVVTALMIYFGLDRNFQAFVLEKFPNYSVNLTRFEKNKVVKEKLEEIK